MLIALLGVRGALLAFGALLPAIVLLRWRAFRELEIGAPVPERDFNLLRGSPIFTPLPIHTLEWLCRALVEVDAGAGQEVITQGQAGDRFYLIEDGEVEVIEDGVFKRTLTAGDGFGEIALLHDVPRTATVRATAPMRLLALDREDFIEAVTGHRRSRQSAEAVASSWRSPALSATLARAEFSGNEAIVDVDRRRDDRRETHLPSGRQRPRRGAREPARWRSSPSRPRPCSGT